MKSDSVTLRDHGAELQFIINEDGLLDVDRNPHSSCPYHLVDVSLDDAEEFANELLTLIARARRGEL